MDTKFKRSTNFHQHTDEHIGGKHNSGTFSSRLLHQAYQVMG
jgi:hypothetical protein